MVDASTEFVKSGFDENTALKLGEIAAAFTNISDSEVDTASAANLIISQMKAFNIESDNAIHVIDAINEVANKTAVSTSDLSGALTKSGSALGTVGNTYEQTIG